MLAPSVQNLYSVEVIKVDIVENCDGVTSE